MSKINVFGLPIEEVIIALFKRVYRKSEHSAERWQWRADTQSKNARDFGDFSPAPIGTDGPPNVDQMRKIIGQGRGYIDRIGPVTLELNLKDPDFLNHGILDISKYENVHHVAHKDGELMVSPQQCIEDLRLSLEQQVLSRRQAEELRKLALATRINFQDCLENKSGQMVCETNEFAPQTEYIVTRHNTSQPWNEINNDIYPDCKYHGLRKEICYGKYTNLTEHVVDKTPSFSSSVSQTVVYNASFSALSEAAGDILFINGLVSEKNAAHVKKATQLLMTFVAGNIYSSAVGFVVSKGLEKTQLISSENAKWAGQAVAIGMNVGTNLFTPTGAAVTAMGFLASHAGVKA